MEIIILGKSNDDKGAQLEQLTVSILKKLGYTDISINEVGDGGNEIDIIGKFAQPSIKNSTARLLICECKANKAPISTTDWMKFLGKIFTNELVYGTVNGCLIALNGANGNVRGMYRILSEKRKDIQLITGEDLIGVFFELYQLKKLDELQSLLTTLTTKKVSGFAICYYDEALYWLITFSANDYTILDHAGNIIPIADLQLVCQIISSTLDYGNFVDLYDEKNRKDRILLAEKYIMAIFLLYGKRMKLDEITTQIHTKQGKYPPPDTTNEEIETAMSNLLEKGAVIFSKNSYQLKILSKGYLQKDVVTFYEMYLKDRIVLMGLGSRIYKRFINEEFIKYIAQTQGNLPIPLEIISDWIQIIRLSPSALGWFIQPDDYLLEHRLKFVSTPELDEADIAYVSQNLAALLTRDFTQSELGDYFFYTCGAKDLATSQSLNISGTKRTIAEVSFKEHISLGIFNETQIIPIRKIAHPPKLKKTVN